MLFLSKNSVKRKVILVLCLSLQKWDIPDLALFSLERKIQTNKPQQQNQPDKTN